MVPPLAPMPGPACRLSQGSGEACSVLHKNLNLCLVGYLSERQGFAFSSHGFLSLIRLSTLCCWKLQVPVSPFFVTVPVPGRNEGTFVPISSNLACTLSE